MQKSYGPGNSQMCRTGAGGGVAGGDGCSYLEPDNWGLVQNTLFIYLFKAVYILAVNEKGHTSFGT